MKRDASIWVGLVMFIMPWLAAGVIGLPASPVRRELAIWFLAIVSGLGGLRVAIFWWQTLAHGIGHSQPCNRLAVVLAHLLLGPVMAYAYYVSSRLDAERGLPTPPDNPRTVVLTSVQFEHIGMPLVAMLRREGVTAELSGQLTAGFRTEAPGQVNVLVNAEDIDLARQILADWEQGRKGGMPPAANPVTG